ncbi:hypothetical protein AAE478_001938 [Parahypoxylon ruwenzoriense]
MEPYRRSGPAISRSWIIAKIVLQLFSLIFCAIVLGLSATTIWEGGGGTGILTIPIASATAAWTMAELVALYLRRRSSMGRGIHPGAHVGVQLVIFLALILSLFYTCMLWRSVQRSMAPCNEWQRDPNDPDWAVQMAEEVGSSGERWYSGTSFYCPESYREMINSPSYRSSVQAIIAFCALLWVVHFTLFVRACVETQRRNSERPAVIVYPQPYGFGYPYGGGPQRPAPVKETPYR